MFDGYNPGTFHDEMFLAGGAGVRGHCQSLLERMDRFPAREFLERKATSELYFLRQGITFNVYHDERGSERIFPFDPVPRVIPADEWEHIETGLTQRIVALNLFLHDIYHGQQILKDGVIPRHYVEQAKHYRPEFRGMDVPADIYIHICGSDLIRDSDGVYYVLEDNGRCPSGASYLLENRNALKRAFPGLFDGIPVRPVDSYARDLLAMLHHVAPHGAGDPVCVLLTPGCHNSAYFEHCYLAREMGIEIVEGRDLVVLDNVVHMRTTRGLVRVDVIYRRIDDDFLDPVVFRKDSVLGVPGLMNAYHAGNVALANAVGTGVADDKGIYPFVPAIIRYYLGQDPILPNVPTYMAAEESDRAYIHRTVFHYAAPVVESHNVLHLEPRTFPFQKTLSSLVRVLPATRLQRFVDLFQNVTHHFELPAPHERLEIESRIRVHNLPLEVPEAAQVAEEAAYADSAVRDRVWTYLQDSPRVRRSPELWRQAIDLSRTKPAFFDKALAIMEWIHNEFRYEPGSTDVTTHLDQCFAERRGVCQDFTHVMLGLCRAVGVPARYASGYLYNGPRDTLVGAQASHAWCEVFLPVVGWIGFDPTNRTLADARYVKVAVGRDYEDVAPIRGTYCGTAHCRMEVSVLVERIE